jgi:hypothetical protein
MLLKILLKIWPALTPIILYIIWNILIKILFKKKDYIEADYKDVNNKTTSNISPYSLKNKQFIFVIYLSLIFLIISFLSFALQN